VEIRFLENLGREVRDSILRLLRDYSEALILALLLALVLRQFVFSAYKVSNVTMEPTLKLGDFIVGYKLPYGMTIPFSGARIGQTPPRRGEVVIFRCPMNTDSACVKRVVGIAGDRVEIKGQRLYVNGVQAAYSRSPSPAPILSADYTLVELKERLLHSDREVLISSANQNVNFGPYIVPPDSFFALGDNRDFSEDSRHWGAVPTKYIEARAVAVWLSIDWERDVNGDYRSRIRRDRFFDRVR